MDQTGSHYDLSASEIIDLKRSSVSDRVIAYMLRAAPMVEARAPVPAPADPGICRPRHPLPPVTLPVSVHASYAR
jgi:hypothetical protein